MLFDHTNPYVTAGYLPDHEQASLALIGAPESGSLVRVPAGPPIASERACEVQAILKSDGSIEGSFVEKLSGEEPSKSISGYRALPKADYVNQIERWVGRSVPGASTSAVEIDDNDASFVRKAHFASTRFAQRPQPRAMIFPAALLHHGELRLTAKTRKYPIVLDADALDEVVRIQLPSDYKVDELPNPGTVESSFGKFEASWTVESVTLIFHRKLEIPTQTIPAAQYQELKKFLDSVEGAAEMPVVLMK